MTGGERVVAADRSFPRRRPVLARRGALGAAVIVGVTALLLFVPKAGTSSAPALVSVTPANAPGSPGFTRYHVRCGPGVRQIPWSHYAPICEPAWHGDNGGATAPGVTGKTITLVYRSASTTELSELYALLPQSVVGTDAEAVHTLQVYINTFNKYFELYGRKVVLVDFTGRSNFISEDTGQDVGLAVEDAISAASTYHAFADMSLVDSSPIYEQDLGDQHVNAFGLYLEDASWYEQRAPYLYTPGPNCSKTAVALGAILGRGMGDLPAIYAGDPSLRSKKRVFGIIHADNPQANQCAQLISGQLARWGHSVAADVGVIFDPSTLVASSQLAVKAMKSAGVTTIICASCDPVSPVFYFGSAQSAGYHPEWVLQSVFAGSATTLGSFVRNDLKLGPSEGSGILSLGNTPVPQADQEAIRAYRQGNGGSLSGILPSYPFAYESLLYFFDLLQAAGPDLTPQTMRAALADTASLAPSTPGGQFGPWVFGAGTVDPASGYQLLHWDPTATSVQDGEAGAYVNCYSGKVFTYAADGTDVPADQQPGCG